MTYQAGVRVNWTPQQESVLVREWEKHTSIREIAKMLGMSTGSVAAKRANMKLPPRLTMKIDHCFESIRAAVEAAGGPVSCNQIVLRTDRRSPIVKDYLGKLRKAGLIHISHWDFIYPYLVPMYVYGWGEDAKQPDVEEMKRSYMRKKLSKPGAVREDKVSRTAIDSRVADMVMIAKRASCRGPAGVFDLIVQQAEAARHASKQAAA